MGDTDLVFSRLFEIKQEFTTSSVLAALTVALVALVEYIS